MILRTPHYYKDFKCIASACKDNCCVGGWQIDIDEETARYYKKLPGAFGDRLRDALDYTDAHCFKLKNGKCPFLTANGLCEIFRELGEDKLGVVCTQFPRFTEYYGDIKESGIGLACEEAARLIFEDNNSFSFDLKELDEVPVKDSEFNEKLAKSLFIYRDKVIALMDIGICMTFTDKLKTILLSAFNIQEHINSNTYDELSEYVCNLNLENILSQISDDNNGADFTICEAIYRILCAYGGLEVLNPDWSLFLDNMFELVETDSEDNALSKMKNENYSNIMKEYLSMQRDNLRMYEYDNLIKYYVFRYFLKASYDHNILGKAVLTVSNWLVILSMDVTQWLENHKSFSFADRINTVHIFSRQVEYSEDNLWQLDEEFMFDDIFKIDSLCNLLDIISTF